MIDNAEQSRLRNSMPTLNFPPPSSPDTSPDVAESAVLQRAEDRLPPTSAHLRLDVGRRVATAADTQMEGSADTSLSGRTQLVGPFIHWGGFAWQAQIALPGGDEPAAPMQSALSFYENDRPLNMAHSQHADIIERGRGRFSHWKDYLVFSASDDSNPNTNGCVYSFDLRARPGIGPDFIGIGGHKCGTEWLWRWLSAHPGIRFPAAKEVHFWDWHRDRPVAWWQSLYPPVDGIKQGEITPGYDILDRDVIAALWASSPSPQLFYSIRNPMARAWSAALHGLRDALMTPDEASDAWFIDHFRSHMSRRWGNYLACLENWLDIVPKKKLMVILFDDIVSDPRGVLKRLAVHIGVDPLYYDIRDAVELAQPVGQGQRYPIRPSLLPILRELYAEQIRSLGRWLDRDLENWLS